MLVNPYTVLYTHTPVLCVCVCVFFDDAIQYQMNYIEMICVGTTCISLNHFHYFFLSSYADSLIKRSLIRKRMVEKICLCIL